MEQVAKAIGFIVYAVASADKHVSPEEKQVVHDIINENWKILADHEDPFGVRALDFIDKMMVVLDEKKVDSEEAFRLFKEVYDENRERFTPGMNNFIVTICIKTAAAFNQLNKAELVLLSRIELLLKAY